MRGLWVGIRWRSEEVGECGFAVHGFGVWCWAAMRLDGYILDGFGNEWVVYSGIQDSKRMAQVCTISIRTRNVNSMHIIVLSDSWTLRCSNVQKLPV